MGDSNLVLNDVSILRVCNLRTWIVYGTLPGEDYASYWVAHLNGIAGLEDPVLIHKTTDLLDNWRAPFLNRGEFIRPTDKTCSIEFERVIGNTILHDCIVFYGDTCINEKLLEQDFINEPFVDNM